MTAPEMSRTDDKRSLGTMLIRALLGDWLANNWSERGLGGVPRFPHVSGLVSEWVPPAQRPSFLPDPGSFCHPPWIDSK
jgi:hypothetical protein